MPGFAFGLRLRSSSYAVTRRRDNFCVSQRLNTKIGGSPGARTRGETAIVTAPLGGWVEAASGHWPDPPRRRARRARATRDHRI